MRWNSSIVAAALCLLCSLHAAAQDDDQSDLRLNPEIEVTAPSAADTDYSRYPFLKLRHNTVHLNGDDWTELGAKYREALAGRGSFTTVYLGDSHIQADFGGNVLRHRLAGSRSRGRGVMIPFKAAGTNEPNDYSVTLSQPYVSSKLMRTPWSTEMPFTGIGLQAQQRRHYLTFATPEAGRHIRLYTRGTAPEVLAVEADGKSVDFLTERDADGLTCVSIDDAAANFRLTLGSDNSTVYGGVEVYGDSTGIVTHSIGNNGATYSAYSMAERFGSGLAALHPDLVIIALGTNEAFGRTTEEELATAIDNLLESIRSYSPGATVLLEGPTECYRRRYTRRRGRRRRSTLVVNGRCATMARAIRLHAEELGIPYYNHYALAGSAQAMRQAKVLGADGVHFTAAGYRLWGDLLGDALLDKLIDRQ